MMRWAIFAASMLAVIVGAASLSGCNTPAGYEVRGGSLCKLGTDGRCYHIGHEWAAYRLDTQFRAHRVK
jgi:hypothetical protein